jgi:NAD(P)H-hydrate epimerase
MKMFTPLDIAIADENAEYLGMPRLLLMENAGRAVAGAVKERLAYTQEKSVVVFAGLGNNGGDGFVSARHLAGEGATVLVVLLGKEEDIGTDIAKANWCILKNMRRHVHLTEVKSAEDIKDIRNQVLCADAVVDAIFGTGIKGKLREPYSSAIDLINDYKGLKVAVDIPSGLDPETGEIHDKAVKANLTVTLHGLKTGLNGKKGYTGEIIVALIGIPPEAEEYVGPGDVKYFMKPREQYSKKGDFGRILVIGGSKDYSGAPALVALAALRTGADIAIVATPKSVADVVRSFSPNIIVKKLNSDVLTSKDLPDLLALVDHCTSIAIGPGLGLDKETIDCVIQFLEIAAKKKPTVVDADALKALSKKPELLAGCGAVFTPHAGEFSILMGCEIAPPQALEKRIGQVQDAAEKVGATILLKGPEDLISDGERYKINKTHNPGMAVGGTGDVLSGVVATFLGWGVEPFRSACAGAFVNGMAGNLAVEERGYHIVATDVIEEIPNVLKRFESESLNMFHASLRSENNC